MSFADIIFYVFSALLIASALAVITARNPVHSALFLVLSFFCCSALWLLLEAEFLAIALVLVYVGAVMVLFLFIVMMLDINLVQIREGFVRYLPIGAFFALCLAGIMVWVVSVISVPGYLIPLLCSRRCITLRITAIPKRLGVFSIPTMFYRLKSLQSFCWLRLLLRSL